MKNFWFFILSLLLTNWAFGNVENNLSKSVIIDPSITKRCDELLTAREQIYKQKNRTQTLLQRVKKNLERTPEEKVSVTQRFYRLMIQLKEKEQLYNLTTKTMEEVFIKNGCPPTKL